MPTLVFFGDKRVVEPLVGASGHEIRHAPRQLEVGDPLRPALRGDLQSSMRSAIDAVARGDADALVSPGSTGALVALSRHLIGLLPTIRRAAIVKRLAAENDSAFRILDVGANVTADAAQLHQYALMGSAAAHANGVAEPKVALLNIGSEVSKGPCVVRDAARLLADDRRLRYVGFIEPHRMFASDVDVVVGEGFAGNLVLKTVEGAAGMARYLLRRQPTPAGEPAMLPGSRMAALQDAYNPQRYNGAVLLGLRKVVVKSHGGANRQGFAAAVREALQASAGDLVNKLAARS